MYNKYVLLLMRLLVLHDAGGGGTFSLLRPDVRAHAGIGALRRARRRAEKC